MTRFVTATALLALLAACDNEQPLNFAGEPPTEPEVTPPVVDEELNPDNLPTVNGVFGPVAGDVDGGSYDPSGDGELRVQITLDGDDTNQLYARDTDRDIAGNTTYRAYSQQDDVLDRAFTAIGAEAGDGDSYAIVAADGGQFTKFFGGVTYGSNSYVAPANGLASYAGTYAGLQNTGRLDDILDSSAYNESLRPRRSTVVTGNIFINADFTDNAINGSIYDRTNEDGADAVDTVFLVPGAISADGSFTGGAEAVVQTTIPNPDNPNEFIVVNTLTNVGSYSGVFGGSNASSIAGGMTIAEYDPDIENEKEYGIFVLDQCGQGGPSPICDAVDDVDE